MSRPSKFYVSREDAPPRAVSVVITDRHECPEVETQEINELAVSALFDVVTTFTTTIKEPKVATYIGAGKIELLTKVLQQFTATTVLFNRDITLTQRRQLEKQLGATVLDRTAIILAVFSLRAKSHEGKLQVERAKCQRQLGQLTGLWAHLERQRGGIGLRGGPGEKQIEIDRRLLAERVKRLDKQIEKMKQRQRLARSRRQKNGIPTVTLVGYTNVGKSTLFNLLSGEQVSARNRPFDTLDTTTRRVHIGNGYHYALADTVGFIRDLPHTLIAGFRATLEQTADSDVLLIVTDYTHPDQQARLEVVFKQLADIRTTDSEIIVVHNKIDKNNLHPKVELSDCGRMHQVYLSCRSQAGVDLLKEVIKKKVNNMLLLRNQTSREQVS